jgi:outer membrane lipoprotein carrier protein
MPRDNHAHESWGLTPNKSGFIINMSKLQRGYIWFFTGIIGLVFFNVIAASANTHNTLTKHLNYIQTMSADFVENTVTCSAKSCNKNSAFSSGIIYLDKLGHFRFDVIKPLAQQILLSNARIMIYEPELEQVTIKNTDNNSSIMQLLSNKNVNLQKEFVLSQEKNNVFTLRAKNMNSELVQITLKFLHNNLVCITMIDQLKQKTTINFTNIKINQHLPNDIFKLNLPKGVDYIES